MRDTKKMRELLAKQEAIMWKDLNKLMRRKQIKELNQKDRTSMMLDKAFRWNAKEANG